MLFVCIFPQQNHGKLVSSINRIYDKELVRCKVHLFQIGVSVNDKFNSTKIIIILIRNRLQSSSKEVAFL